MSSALPLYNLKYPLDYFKFTIGITVYFILKLQTITYRRDNREYRIINNSILFKIIII